jgi:arsenical pump membrane protein
VVGLVLIGFTAGRALGVAPWVVALGADVVLAAVVRDIPWRAIPLATAVIAASLGVLAAAAVTHLPVDRVIGGHGALGAAGTIGASALGANVINNLPALLVALPTVGHHTGRTLWAVLIGVNMGPVVMVTGSLASLLWLDALGRMGVEVHPRDFTRIGVRVGLPAALAGGLVAVALGTLIR